MSQAQTPDFAIDPYATNGKQLADILNRLHDSFITRHSGAARPPYAKAGVVWMDVSTPPGVLKWFDGTNDYNILHTGQGFAMPGGGSQGQVLQKDSSVDGDASWTDGVVTGTISMFAVDIPPPGWLICDGRFYNVDDYPNLGRLLGGTPGGKFNVPDINFAKNSRGTNTLQQQAESVGTHGHTANPLADHAHGLRINGAGNHGHSCSSTGSHSHGYTVGLLKNMGQPGGTNTVRSLGSKNTSSAGGHSHSIGSGGAHGHGGSVLAGGGVTPVVNDHTGTNQPACTLVNFIIKI